MLQKSLGLRYLRNRPDRGDDLRALVISSAVAAGVGVVTFYFTRLLLAREPLVAGGGSTMARNSQAGTRGSRESSGRINPS